MPGAPDAKMADDDIIDDALRLNMEAFDGKADWLAERYDGTLVVFRDAAFVDALDAFERLATP